jgi:hypothetical protein
MPAMSTHTDSTPMSTFAYETPLAQPETNADPMVSNAKDTTVDSPARQGYTNTKKAHPIAKQPQTGVPECVQHAQYVLHVWNHLMERELDHIHRLADASEKLWCEDQQLWNEGKNHVAHGSWSVEEFDRHVKDLMDEQAPIWAKLKAMTGELREKMDQPWKDVLQAEECVAHECSSEPAPKGKFRVFARLFGKAPLSPPTAPRVADFFYHGSPLMSKFLQAHEYHQLVSSYPSGLLTKIELLHQNAAEKTADVSKEIHDYEHTRAHHLTTSE